MIAAKVVLVTVDVNADEDREIVMEEAAEVVARVIEIAEELSDFDGIDISNPTRAFTDKEWTTLGPGGGQAHVTQQHMMIN